MKQTCKDKEQFACCGSSSKTVALNLSQFSYYLSQQMRKGVFGAFFVFFFPKMISSQHHVRIYPKFLLLQTVLTNPLSLQSSAYFFCPSLWYLVHVMLIF